MKLRILFFTLFAFLPCLGAHAAIPETQNCINAIAQNKEIFHDILVGEILKTDQDFTQSVISRNKAKIMHLLAGDVLVTCPESLLTILSDTGRAKLSFEHNGKKYAFDFSVPEMLEYIELNTGIMVYNGVKTVGDVIELKDIPKLYWSSECSDHVIWENLSDDAAVNVAGQKTFSEQGGSKNEYFLDFEEGNNRRAFPGLVLVDVTGSTKEKIVTYSNLLQGQAKAEQFANNLQSSECSGQRLHVYQVALDVYKKSDVQKTGNDRQGWLIAAGVTGGTMALLGVGAALAKTTVLAATGSMLLVKAGLGLAAIPVWGWIAGGLLVTGAAAVAMIPTKIQDIQQVMVVSGPYSIR